MKNADYRKQVFIELYCRYNFAILKVIINSCRYTSAYLKVMINSSRAWLWFNVLVWWWSAILVIKICCFDFCTTCCFTIDVVVGCEYRGFSYFLYFSSNVVFCMGWFCWLLVFVIAWSKLLFHILWLFYVGGFDIGGFEIGVLIVFYHYYGVLN